MELSLNFHHHQLFGFGNACLGEKLNVAKNSHKTREHRQRTVFLTFQMTRVSLFFWRFGDLTEEANVIVSMAWFGKHFAANSRIS